jgi:hypothetical protein
LRLLLRCFQFSQFFPGLHGRLVIGIGFFPLSAYTSGSNQDDDGLNGKEGTFKSIEWTEAGRMANPPGEG